MEENMRKMKKANEEYAVQVAEITKTAFERMFGRMDDRDKMMLKDSLMNDLYGSNATSKAITNGEGPSREETTIDEVITKL
eukprot:659386-Rhodomonas_salina.1